jgi:hypothetical protein
MASLEYLEKMKRLQDKQHERCALRCFFNAFSYSEVRTFRLAESSLNLVWENSSLAAYPFKYVARLWAHMIWCPANRYGGSRMIELHTVATIIPAMPNAQDDRNAERFELPNGTK